MKNFARFAIPVIAIIALAFSLCACSSGQGQSSSASSGASSASESQATGASGGQNSSNTRHAEVKVAGYQPFTIELYPEYAPISVENFCNLAESGYYDGLKFYRIVEGFCIQGGTAGNSASGSDPNLTPIVGEFAENEIDNPLADDFQRGTVAMARTGQYDSATSTFFITLATSQNVSMSLDGQYAAFGMVDEDGMRVVNSIVRTYLKYATGEGGAIDNPDDMPVIESITIVD